MFGVNPLAKVAAVTWGMFEVDELPPEPPEPPEPPDPQQPGRERKRRQATTAASSQRNLDFAAEDDVDRSVTLVTSKSFGYRVAGDVFGPMFTSVSAIVPDVQTLAMGFL
jgi:hypothetical protein